MKKYNYRNKFGKFTVKPSNLDLINGRLYKVKGVVARLEKREGLRFRIHNTFLSRNVTEKDVELANEREVKNYMKYC
jgi:hypothetical protein